MLKAPQPGNVGGVLRTATCALPSLHVSTITQDFGLDRPGLIGGWCSNIWEDFLASSDVAVRMIAVRRTPPTLWRPPMTWVASSPRLSLDRTGIIGGWCSNIWEICWIE